MSYIEDIKIAILRLDSASYQKLCDEFLNECGYSNIVGLGSEPGVNKTTSGTPDTYLCNDANGNYIFIEYTTQQTSIYSKIKSDITKCLDEAFTHIKCDKISEIWYFHTTSNLTPEQDAELKEHCKSKGILLHIYGIDYFANELYNRHKYLVKQHLGISIATEQILSYTDFVHAYNQAKTAAPIDTEFKFRSEEINSILSALEDNKTVLLCGVAGVGKTRLALECCRRYAEKNGYQIFCIRNNNQPIYEDLHLFFGQSGNYIILIDDANELTQLETILNFFIEHSDANYKIIFSVRNYAAKEISTTVKTLLDIAVLNIIPLRDNEIEELLKETYGIKNHRFLERIIKIAEGNARIALLAGKIAVESKSLDLIKDVASLYNLYYGQHLSKIGLSDDLLLVAGITAFVGAIHLDHLDTLQDVISLSGVSIETFRESLYELHKAEIVNIFKNKAVRFADQCLSNYLLYHVFMDRKLVRLSDVIRYTFKVNKSQTINSINVLTQLYSTSDSQEYLFSEIRHLWLILEKEDPGFFWEYVKVFYLVNPTDSLLLVKSKIESTTQIITQIDELTIDERNTTVSDDILTILGGFANREELDTALDLYFLYFQKRPDLIQLFYNTAVNCYGVSYDDYMYDFRTLFMYLRKLVDNTEDWQNIFACKLLVYIAKYFLQFSFNSMGSKGRNSITMYTIPLQPSKGTIEYRQLLWKSLIELYSQGIETQMIEEILYYYGKGSSQDSAGVMEKDYPFILTLLKLYKEPESYFFCRNIDNLHRVFKFMDIPQGNEFDTFFESESFRLYKTFDRTDERGLTFLEKDDVSKKAIEEYVSPLSKEEFFAVIDFFFHSPIESGFYTNKLINYAFEYILIHKEYFLDALMHYFSSQHKQSPLYPHYLVALMFDKYTNDEIWSIISCAPDTMRNTWQFYFFAAMPDKYIDNNHIHKWYDYLKDDSDKYLTSFGYRELLFISKYQEVDKDIIRKSMQIILSKQIYSLSAVEMYTTLLLNSLTENIDVTIEFFKGNYDLLCELYVLIATKKRQEDYHGELLKAIYEKQPLIVDMLFEQWNTREKYLSHDDTMKLSKLFEVDDFEAIFDHIMDIVASSDKAYLYQEDELSSMIAIANITEQYRDRPDTWIKHYIAVNAEDDRKMYLISCAILGLSEEKRIEYLTLFLSRNTNIDSFKNWQLLTLSMSWSGSEVPLIQKRIDFLVRILPLLSGLKFLEHKKFIEDRISDLKQYMANVEIEEILRGID